MIKQIEKLRMANGRIADGFCMCRESEVDAVNDLLEDAIETDDSYVIPKPDSPEEAKEVLEDILKIYMDELSTTMVHRIKRVLGV